jgi:hydroxymethylbilane synthase
MRIATRGSALALAQAEHVGRLLEPTHPGTELVQIVTSGDRRRNVDDKREWVAEIEDALADGRADLAVHSAKDVPAALPGGFTMAGFPEREEPWDALCGAPSLEALPDGARVGTSSLRRSAQLHALRPDLEIVELRGNIDTRLRKLHDGGYDAIVLALAGLKRLGLQAEVGCVLTELVPSPGQGALLLECRNDHVEAIRAAAGIVDRATLRCVNAERALVRELGADCHTPMGAHATLAGGVLTLRAFVGAVDGSSWLSDTLSMDDPEPAQPPAPGERPAGAGVPDALGEAMARRLLAAGAAELLSDASGAAS